MYSRKKVFITTSSDIGFKCRCWAEDNYSDDFEFVDEESGADYIFSVFHNKVFSADCLSKKAGAFNFHAGILPDYRGSCTINWAIMNGETETGVTLHLMERNVDCGAIIHVEKINLLPSDTSETLYKKSETVVYFLFKKFFIDLINGNYRAVPQSIDDGRLYKRREIETAKNITNIIRAFEHTERERAYYFDRFGKKVYVKF